jgi:hypothetical protein
MGTAAYPVIRIRLSKASGSTPAMLIPDEDSFRVSIVLLHSQLLLQNQPIKIGEFIPGRPEKYSASDVGQPEAVS